MAVESVRSPADRSYRRDVYTHYLGEETDPGEFVRTVDTRSMDRQFRARWAKFLPADKTAPVLDLGCGWGPFLHYLKGEGHTQLFGVDASPQQVEIAHRLGLAGVGLGDVFETVDRYENYFGCVSAFNLLEHLDKDRVIPFLRGICRALRPGGKLLLELPNANSSFGSRTRYWDFTHELSFTPTSMAQLMRVSGFRETEFRERGPVVHGLKSWVRMVLWRVVRLGIRCYLVNEQGESGYPVYSQDMHVIATR
jgi:cyclopropane fatty-acyl-phospholipid synthase-like methyltransferase